MATDNIFIVMLISIVSNASKNSSPTSISSIVSSRLVIAVVASISVLPLITPAAPLTTCWPTSKTAIVMLKVFVTR